MNIKPNKESILIIGGTGFIGKNVVKEAVRRKYRVTVFSKRKCHKNNRIDDVEYIKVNISNKKLLSKELRGKTFENVINIGGYVNHGNYDHSGKEIIDSHLLGTINVVDQLNKQKLKCYVNIGSSDEYGDNPSPQNEIMRESPISSYSFAKSASTHFLQMLFREHGFPVVIFRLFLVYGPGQDTNRLIPHIIDGCIKNQEFHLSPGGQTRDFCYIDDVVNAIFLALDKKNIHGEVINIGSGIPVKIKDLVLLIQSLIGKGKPQFGKVPYRKGENMSLYADISKARRLLNWQPKVSLSNGIQRMLLNEPSSTNKCNS